MRLGSGYKNMELKKAQVEQIQYLMDIREQLEIDLRKSLKATRNEESYISLADVAQIIREELGDEALLLKDKL
mgnify:CR=1 FL=1